MVETEKVTTPPAPRPGSTPPTGSPATSRPDSGERRRFDVVLRGYERTAVDEDLARREKEVEAIRRELAESERRRTLAEQHAEATESEIRTLRSDLQTGPRAAPEDSFGFRAEKLLRLAEQESVEMRANAARDAAAMVEQARADAEQHRHEVEQTLISRSALLDQQAAQRAGELKEREQQIGSQLTAAQSEIEGMHEAADRSIDQLRQQAETEAQAVRARAAQDAKRLREQAEQEVTRLESLRDGARAEITRLADLLADGLGSSAGDRTGGQRQRPAAGGRANGNEGARQGSDGAEPAAKAQVVRAAGS